MEATRSAKGRWEKSTINENGEKPCARCGQMKPVSQFYKDKQTSLGLTSYCKRCVFMATTASVSSHIDHYAKRLASTGRQSSNSTKARSERIGDDLLTADTVVDLWHKQGGKCALTDKQMTHTVGAGRIRTNVSADRIDNSRGYAHGNVRLVCGQANMMRGDMSDDELYEWCEAILAHRDAKRGAAKVG